MTQCFFFKSVRCSRDGAHHQLKQGGWSPSAHSTAQLCFLDVEIVMRDVCAALKGNAMKELAMNEHSHSGETLPLADMPTCTCLHHYQ